MRLPLPFPLPLPRLLRLAAPSPDSEPYVSVGKRVKKGDVVCIIEAMKCMNEIQAEEDGEITAVLATNGELVEYGQPLFAIK